MNSIDVLRIRLHGQIAGYLISLSQGQNRFYFDSDYVMDEHRSTFSLTTHPNFPSHEQMLTIPWVIWQRLHPILSNLLPEGNLREFLARQFKIHIDHEFLMLKHLGQDLPGAITAEAIHLEELPSAILNKLDIKMGDQVQYPSDTQGTTSPTRTSFSLAGVQEKFSMRQIFTGNKERFTLLTPGHNYPNLLGDWIVKTPSQSHPFVPENEYSMMRLAQLVKVDIPEIKLIPINSLLGVNVRETTHEQYAYAIKRFDRQLQLNNEMMRVHSEDFAQILVRYPHEKYQGGNYVQIAKILYRFSESGLSDVNQLARRILVNILIANGDAHLKNWSVIYKDNRNPSLSPAYDLVHTKAYIPDESSFSLNLADSKNWYKINLSHFEHWARKSDIPWRSIKPQLIEVLSIARETWLNALNDLPMAEAHKQTLIEHWSMLSDDFKLVKKF